MNKKEKGHIKETIRKLTTYNNASFPILSVYLENANQEEGAKLTEKFRSLQFALSQNQQKQIQNEVLYIENYLRMHYDRKPTRGIAFYVGGNSLWEVLHYDYFIHPQIQLSYSPFLQPILQQLQREKRYLIILADREKAELFIFQGNNVEAYAEIMDPSVPQKVKSTKELLGRDTHISRHIQDHIHRHLQVISEKTDKFLEGKPVSGVVIGGHQEMFHQIKKHLCPALQKKVIGEFISELHIPHNDLVQHSQEALEKFIKHYEKE